MEKINLKYSLGKHGIDPVQATEQSACFDLALPKEIQLPAKVITTIDLDIAFDIPDDYYMEIFPRSGLQYKYGIISSTGIIDTDYKGYVHAILYNTTDAVITFNKGARVVQAILKKKENVRLEKIDKFFKSNERGKLGSSGLYELKEAKDDEDIQ